MRSAYPLVPIGELVSSVRKWNPCESATNKLFTYIDIASINRETKQIEGAVEILTHDAPSRARQIVKAGDILISTVRPNLNAVAHLDSQFDGATASTGFTVLRTKPQKLNSRYLYYWVRTSYFIEDMVRRSTGASYPAVSDSIIKEYSIPLPQLEEQRRIAAILDKADAVHRKRQEAIALTEELLRSAFLEMFGDLILFMGGRSSSHPTDWSACKLGDQITLQRGFDITKKQCQESIYPVISSGGVSAYHSEYKALGPGVLLGRKGSVGRVHYVEENYWPHDTTLWVKDFKGNHPIFVYYFFKWFPISDYEASTSNPKLNRNRLHPVDVLWPPYALQNRFAAIFQSVSKCKNLTEYAMSKSNNLFNSLLQRAFRGEL